MPAGAVGMAEGEIGLGMKALSVWERVNERRRGGVSVANLATLTPNTRSQPQFHRLRLTCLPADQNWMAKHNQENNRDSHVKAAVKFVLLVKKRNGEENRVNGFHIDGQGRC